MARRRARQGAPQGRVGLWRIDGGGRAWYPSCDPVREITAAGTAQIRAVREAEEGFGPDAAATERMITTMARDGMAASAIRIQDELDGLDRELRYGQGLTEAAEEAAAGMDARDPRRAREIVRGQERAIRDAGHGAVMRFRRVAVCTRALNVMLPRWANASGRLRRDTAVSEYAGAMEAKKFSRPPHKKYRFTGMTANLFLKQHSRNQLAMFIDRHAILSSTYTVEYYGLRARLSSDPEEIDSPKFARNAHECEVRIPDGALVSTGGIVAVARKSRLKPADIGILERMMARGANVHVGEEL